MIPRTRPRHPIGIPRVGSEKAKIQIAVRAAIIRSHHNGRRSMAFSARSQACFLAARVGKRVSSGNSESMS